ncbi:unnamed protein product, partial [Amoebophrya sp. A120]|eukprot:GSA120T00006001001.1
MSLAELKMMYALRHQNGEEISTDRLEVAVNGLLPAEHEGTIDKSQLEAYDFDGNSHLSLDEVKLLVQVEENDDDLIANSDALGIANGVLGESNKLKDVAELGTYDLDDDGKMSLEELKVMYTLRQNDGKIKQAQLVDISRNLLPLGESWPNWFESTHEQHRFGQTLSLKELTAAVRQPAAFDPSHNYNEAEERNYRELLLQSSPNSYSFGQISSTNGGENPADGMQKIFDALQIDGGDFTEDEFNQRDLDGDGHIDGK